jgi:hypothetical protein
MQLVPLQSGTRANKEKEARRRFVGVRNSQNVRWMYKVGAGQVELS